ncbi:MAG TPA: hypothetical protein VGE98_13925 [Thermoanaerobaculia bacterium]
MARRLLLAALLATAAACSTAPPPPPPAPTPSEAALSARREHLFLLDPLDGYPAAIDPGRRERIERAYRDLSGSGDVAAARRTSAELLSVAPSLYPAQVLAAQADFLEGHYQEVVDRLLPVGDAFAGYTASQMLLGRACELLGDIPLAYAAYRAIAPHNPKAFERTGSLHGRAIEALGLRLQDALAKGRQQEAEKDLDLLKSWGPTETASLEAARAVAVAQGDKVAELAAVKGLSQRRPNDRELLERRADLELQFGDPGAGLQIVQDLADHHPEDPALREKLASAKFRWRLSLLPKQVQEVAAKPELAKADMAVLLYWLVPSVRSARPTAGRIATDILDHPRREEIVRIVNLGVMDVDPTQHRFSPAQPLRRGPALRALVRVLARFGSDLPCLSEGTGTTGSVCDTALACDLVASEESCDPQGAISGSEAVEMIRLGLHLLGGA